jgi:hypothetical protein
MNHSASSGSETQKLHVFSHMWMIDPKINIHKKKHDHIELRVEYVCNSGTTLWNSGNEWKDITDRASVISHNVTCEDKGYKDMYWKLLKNGEWKVKE